jgi:dTDP-4-amino-4,6-dideoxygalactose transaminase
VIIKAKLKKLDSWTKAKRKICQRYTQELNSVVVTPKEAPWSYHTYYVYVIEVPKGTRDKLQAFLKQKGISTNIHYKLPTHTTKAFKEHSWVSLPRTEYVCKNILSLPCYHTLTTAQQDYIIKNIKEFYAN